ncbi:MAG: anti-sigma factor domain-containing protein, partial [Clostridia bacterium]|nr:anti-sigma factor domain-containing protein [Clostridia bacterium]
MKAVVMEKKSGHAALLTDGGDVVRTRDRGYEIGEVVDMRENREGSRGRLIAILSAAAIFVMLFAGGIFAYNTPYYYVSMDVNPGMVMEVNMFERVIGVEAMNEEAQAVLAELRLRNMNIEDAVAEALGGITSAGYLANENNNVVIAALSKNSDNAERLAGKLKGAAEDEILDNGVRAEVSAGALGYDMVQQAKELGITPGKLNIITNLLGEEVTEE